MPRKKQKTTQKVFNKNTLSKLILNLYNENPRNELNYKQVSKQLGIKDETQRGLVNEVLKQLAESGNLKEVYRGKYKLKSKGAYIIGNVSLTKSGYGFIVTDALEDDVFVSQNNLNHALHGDLVKVMVFASRKGRNTEGEVVEILEHARKTFVGTLEVLKNFAFLSPGSQNMPYDLFIPLEKLNGAKDGMKAIAQINDWPKQAKNPFGEIIEVLGYPGNNDVEMHAILAEFELPYSFPKEVDDSAEKIDPAITKEEIAKRRDFRKIPTFTIDPADAKDFDDALSFQQLKNGNIEVGIHIADVTHYVQPKTILEEEALERATSVYLVDRVVPMLPERLSNFICSLRPNEDKLCFSAVFELNEDAEIKNEWFGKTIIQSQRRFAYEEAQEVIETGKGDMSHEILTLNSLARKLRAKRFENGSIAFERSEVKFEIDEIGNPLRVFFKEMKESNQLIEEFMLLANKQVAGFVQKMKQDGKEKTFVYRIHDQPNEEKLEDFSQFAHRFGYNLKITNKQQLSRSINELLRKVRGKSEQNIIETLAVRTMAKAIYSTENIGHYGLSFQNYTHFTSPIRRYPDMMVHRLLAHYLENGPSKSQKKYEKYCRHSSEMERKATEAERASIKYKQVEFMSDKIGKVFKGVISGVTEFGLFVEIIENKCEGLIPINELDDDFYQLDDKNYMLVGRHHRKTYQLGNEIDVEVWRTNLARKQLDFRLADKEE